MEKISIITVITDFEWDLPLPDELFESVGTKAAFNSSWQQIVPPKDTELAHGVGPEIAAILIAISSPLWEYAVAKVLDGLVKTVKVKWFSKASSKAEKVRETSKEDNIFSRARNKKIQASETHDFQKLDDPFPYALMNVAISSNNKSSKRYVQVLFPYPMTDNDAERAVSELKEILYHVGPNSGGVMYYDKTIPKWILQGTIKIIEE